MSRLDTLVWKQRNILAGLPLAFMLFSTRGEVEGKHTLIWSLGITLCGLGIIVRSWASCHCPYAQRRPMELATSGPYAYVRHPLYIGNLLIITSAAVASEVLWFVPVVVVWASLVYARVSRYEEDLLTRKFGEAFVRYRAAVPKWLPVPRRVSFGTSNASFAAVALRQCQNLLILAPFLIKELNPFGLWHHP